MKNTIKKNPILSVMLAGFLLRIISLNQSFWLDEAAQAVISSSPFFSINFGADFQPPLFYLLTHIWQRIGVESEWFLRIPSVLIGILSIYVLIIFIEKVFGKKQGIIAGALLATSSFHIYFSQEYRMYGLVGLLSILSWYFLWDKKYIKYLISITLLIFTHYFAFLVIASQLIFKLLWRKSDFKRYIKYLALGLSPFILWIPTLTKQLQTASQLVTVWPRWAGISGIPLMRFPGLLLAKFAVGMISPENRYVYIASVFILGILFTLTLILIILKVLRASGAEIGNILRSASARQNTKYWMLLLWFFIPAILAWLSILWLNANSPHRLIFLVIPFYAILSVGLLLIKDTKLSRLLILAVISLNLFFSLQYLSLSKYHREDWRGAIEYTDNIVKKRGVVLSEFVQPWAPMDWYSTKRSKYMGASSRMVISDKSISEKINRILQKNRQIILFTYLFEVSDPNFRVGEYIKKGGYILGREKDFRGVGIIKVFDRID